MEYTWDSLDTPQHFSSFRKNMQKEGLAHCLQLPVWIQPDKMLSAPWPIRFKENMIMSHLMFMNAVMQREIV